MKEEKRKMREDLNSLETTHMELLQQLQSMKEELFTLKKKEKENNKEKEKSNYSLSDICEMEPVMDEISQDQEVDHDPEHEKESVNKTTTTTTCVGTGVVGVGVVFKELDKSQCYACKQCGTHIGLESDVNNKCYQVGQGAFTEKKRGYLFGNAVNLTLGVTKTENFSTGSYDISWVTCGKCNTSLGWKYLSASNESNASKVGKFCLARYSLTSPQDRTQ